MSVQKGKATVSASVSLSGNNQQRNITPQQRGTTPPTFSARGKEEQTVQQGVPPYYQYQTTYFPSQTPPLNPHEIDKSLGSQQQLAGSQLGHTSMFHNSGIRGNPQTFYPSQTQNIRQPARGYSMNQQPPQTTYTPTMMYMNMSQAASSAPFGTPILVQPTNQQPLMMPGGMNYMNPTVYPMQPGTNPGGYNQLTRYSVQNQQRSQGNATASSQSKPQRERQKLAIVDPSTGKNVLEDMDTPQSETRSTTQSPASSVTSGSSSNEGANIRAQFAQKVAATMKPNEMDENHLQSVPEFIPASKTQHESSPAACPDTAEAISVDSEQSIAVSEDTVGENIAVPETDYIEGSPLESAPAEATCSPPSVDLPSKEDAKTISLSETVQSTEDSEAESQPKEFSVSTEEPSDSVVNSLAVMSSSSEESVPPQEKEQTSPIVEKSESASTEFVSKSTSADNVDEPSSVYARDGSPVDEAKKPEEVSNTEETEPTTTEEVIDDSNKVPIVDVEIEDKDAEEMEEEEAEDEDSKDDMDKNSQPQLKYSYKADQWSPLNMEGKRLYDREFLLQMQFALESTTKPAGLPDLPDIILDKPHDKPSGQKFGSGVGPHTGGRSFDFTPGYVKSPKPPEMGRRSSGQLRPSNSRGRAGPTKIIPSISRDLPPLQTSENAWKPGKVQVADGEDEKSAALYKKTRSILNKLTPQKFQTLVKQIAEMDIDTEERLKGVTDLIFEKAVSEPGFSVAYANMCRYMTKVKSDTKQGETVNFRAILLTRCQKEFEKDKESEHDIEEMRKKLKDAPEDQKNQLREELEFAEMKARKRSLGNIRFIGELFKLKMLTENIMHDCLFKLLRAKDPDTLECLCRLMTTIGKELDTEKAKPRMDQYFTQMKKIVDEKKVPSRIRFMLQDVLDLRTNKWVPRRDDNNPKTLDQIHKEAKKEEEERNQAIQQAALAHQAASRDKGPKGRRGQGPSGQMTDGWNTVGRTPQLRVTANDRPAIDPSRLKLSKQNVDESNIQLGPGGGAGRFAGWQRGSTGGGLRNSQEGERPNTPGNRFSALNRTSEEDHKRYGSSPSRGRPSGGYGHKGRMTPRSSQEQENVIAAARNFMGGATTPREGLSRESSRGRGDLREEKREADTTSMPPPAAPKQLTDDEMEKKTIAILDEFLHIQDMKEAKLCVEEIKGSNNLYKFVSTAINHVLERSKQARSQTGLLLHDLVKGKIISVENYLKGLQEMLQSAEEMEIDIPMIWKYFGELIAPMVQDKSIPMNFLKQIAQPLLECNKAGILIAEVLHDASDRQGHKNVGSLWRASDLKWSDFVPENEIPTFLQENHLEFTINGGSQPTTPTDALPMEKIEESLLSLLQANKNNEDIFDWIETNLDDNTTKSNKFVRCLMTAVCTSALSRQGSSAKVDNMRIKLRGPVLRKFLDPEAEFELQALYALQALDCKMEHPAGVLRTLFDLLYDEDIISEDAFTQWEKSTDPNEQEGKGVALRQVTSFFTWLREPDEDGEASES